MSTYLVTGGAGFIGSNIVGALVEKGEKVKVLDNFFSGRRENIASFLDRIELIEGDIRDRGLLAKAFAGVDFVLHQAALRSVPQSLKDPIAYNEVNVGGTLNVLMAARDAGVKRVVFASSSSVYGNCEKFPEKETHPTAPISPYGASKMAGELYNRVFAGVFALETVSLRYFNVFGPRQDPASEYAAVIPKFILAILKDSPPTIHGDGSQSRDFTYVENVVRANLLAATTPGIGGEVFNVATSHEHSVMEIAEKVNRILNKKVRPIFGPRRQGDPLRSLADVTKAKKLMGWEPQVDFAEGLKKTVEWFRPGV